MTVGVFKHVCALDRVDALTDRRVGTLAVEQQLAILAQDHRHALAHVVEVENAEQLVRLLLAKLRDRDRVRRARLTTYKRRFCCSR